MILETAQLLSGCWWHHDPVKAEQWYTEDKIYKKTHGNHPCSIWTRECQENYIWLCHLGLALCKEWAYRYDHKPSDHKCYPILMFLITHVPDIDTNDGTITIPKMAMPDNYKCSDPVYSYRTYYLNDKLSMLVWRKRDPPPWVPDHIQSVHYKSEHDRLSSQLKKLESRTRKTQDHLNEIQSLKLELSIILQKWNK